MRTPLVMLVGQCTASVATVLLARPRTAVISHQFDGHVVQRRVSVLRAGQEWASDRILEVAGQSVSTLIRNDLLVLLRRVHRRDDIDRIVVVLDEWMEPEPLCYEISHTMTFLGSGYRDGPASDDVDITAVVTCIDTSTWLDRALGDAELYDGRSVAAVVVEQAEFSDVLVLTSPDRRSEAVLRRLAPKARITCAAGEIEDALQELHPQSRAGIDFDPHAPVLAGEPPLNPDGDVVLVDFAAARPFHPDRLLDAIDVLLAGVVRARGRIWLASQTDTVVWIESIGSRLAVANAGIWLAAMPPSALETTDAERRALAAVHWDEQHGDRHVAIAVLACGADPLAIRAALAEALLTEDEFAEPHKWGAYADPFSDWRVETSNTAVLDADIFTGNSTDDRDLS